MTEKSKEEGSIGPDEEQRQKDEARAVAKFAANREDCRRVLILLQFRETYSRLSCVDGCDNCLEHHDAVVQDVTADALKILKLAESASGGKINFTEIELVAAFKGRSHKSTAHKGLDQLQYSAAGAGLDQSLIERIIGYLVREEGLAPYELVAGQGYNVTYLKVSTGN